MEATAQVPEKKELTEKQIAKFKRYNAIKKNLNSMGSTLSKQQKFLAQLDSVLLKDGRAAFDPKVRELEGVWAAEKAESESKKAAPKTQKKNSAPAAAANNSKPVKTPAKSKKNAAPTLSNEEQLAILQKRIAVKKNAEALYKNIYGKNATNVTRNKTKMNAILAKLAEGASANAIKANVKSKRNAATKKRLATIASKKAAAPAPVNPFNSDYDEPAVPAAMSTNPFNNF